MIPASDAAVATVVLAAGAGRRLGGPKGLARWRGRTFLDHVLDTLEAADLRGPVVVVTGAAAEAVGRIARARRAAPLHNPDWEAGGMLSSLVAALDALPPVGALLSWPVDHPAASSETVAALVARWRETGAPVVLPTWQGRGGHPVLFDAATFPALREAPPDRGARAVVRGLGDRVQRVAVEDPGVRLDVDTPAVLARLQAT